MRLDLAVSRRFGLSRRAAREAVRAGRMDVAGVTQDEPGAEVSDGADLSHHPGRPARHSVRTRLSVLHEDADLIIVEKPAGLLAVPTAEREKDTLLSRVSLYLQPVQDLQIDARVLCLRTPSGAIISASTTPAAKMSARASSASPRDCSGAM